MQDRLEIIKKEISRCSTDEEIARKLEITVEEVERRKAELYKKHKSILQVREEIDEYLDYTWQQTECIRQLDDLIENWKDSRHQAMIVTAIRVKSEIIDKIFKRGQEIGILRGTREERAKLASMSAKELMQALERELMSFKAMVEKSAAISIRVDRKRAVARENQESPY